MLAAEQDDNSLVWSTESQYKNIKTFKIFIRDVVYVNGKWQMHTFVDVIRPQISTTTTQTHLQAYLI